MKSTVLSPTVYYLICPTESDLKLIVSIPLNLIETLLYSHQSGTKFMYALLGQCINVNLCLCITYTVHTEDPVHSSSAVVLHNDLTISDEYLGCGSFGEVYKGTYKGNPCAVKIASRSHLKPREWEILKEMKQALQVVCSSPNRRRRRRPTSIYIPPQPATAGREKASRDP